VYRRILGPVYDNEKENWWILTNKEIYARVKKPAIIETIGLNRLHWFGHVQRMEENRIPKRVLYMNLGTTRFIHSFIMHSVNPYKVKIKPIGYGACHDANVI
jgi:hypothetical protein